ncbi:MAG: PLP-dependent aminotransferase family protein [Pseudomonadota bacterium]
MTRKLLKTRSIAPLLRIDPASTLSLQAQLRTRIVEAINASVLVPGRRLPSSRKLASELGISRNTASLAYQQLIADGHLVARERSGVFVADSPVLVKHPARAIASRSHDDTASEARTKMHAQLATSVGFRCPPDWQKYRYPFIEGRYDQSLFPVAEWREASRLALGVKEIETWSIDDGDADDEMLIEEIRTKLLPRRGITARPDEILITAGEQQALHLLAELFARPGITLGMEEPGLPSMRELVALRAAEARYLDIDEDGLIVGPEISECDIVHVSPSRQRPTGVTMSMKRREALIAAANTNDFLIIEDDFECEMNYLREAQPALHAMTGGERVLYVAALSKLLAPGIRLGYLVAPADVISAARRLRGLTTKRPSPNNQRTAAYFLSLGHYDAMLTRLNRVCEQRLIALRDALNHYRPESIAIPPVDGGTAYWVKGPDGLDANRLVKAAEAKGMVIEPASDYFADPVGRKNMFRLGITSLPVDRIRPGVELLSQVMRDLGTETGDGRMAEHDHLAGTAVRKALSGATLLYKTVYGEPCTIEVRRNGTLVGRAGYANEDRDEGKWWIEGDRWYRSWDRWAYGESAGFFVAVEGDALYWLNDDGRVVDGAVIVSERTQSA